MYLSKIQHTLPAWACFGTGRTALSSSVRPPTPFPPARGAGTTADRALGAMPVAGTLVSREHREPGRRAAGGRWRAASLAAAWLALSVIPGANDAAYAQQADLPEEPVPFSWSLKPAGLDTGDRFRLLFITDGQTRANTEGFENYDRHVRNAIAGGHTDIREYARHFRAVVSTSDTDARDHIGATGDGVLIHWLNGHRAASDYSDFFDSVLTETPRDETGRNSSDGSSRSETCAPRGIGWIPSGSM